MRGGGEAAQRARIRTRRERRARAAPCSLPLPLSLPPSISPFPPPSPPALSLRVGEIPGERTARDGAGRWRTARAGGRRRLADHVPDRLGWSWMVTVHGKGSWSPGRAPQARRGSRPCSGGLSARSPVHVPRHGHVRGRSARSQRPSPAPRRRRPRPVTSPLRGRDFTARRGQYVAPAWYAPTCGPAARGWAVDGLMV